MHHKWKWLDSINKSSYWPCQKLGMMCSDVPSVYKMVAQSKLSSVATEIRLLWRSLLCNHGFETQKLVRKQVW